MSKYLGNLMERFDNGDPLSDEELRDLNVAIGKALNDLDHLRYPAYRLVENDLMRKQETLISYARARQEK